MTNSEHSGESSQVPSPNANVDPAAPQQPYAPTAVIDTPAPTAPKKPITLALVALIVGIVAFLLGLVPVLGALAGIAAVVTGALALRKGQPKGLAVTGLILGGVAALASIGVTAGISTVVNTVAEREPAAIVEQADEDTIAEEPEAPVAAPVETEEAAPEPEVPSVPVEYASALAKAATYSEMMHMSKAGLYDQLTSEYGEQFTPEAGQYAIDNVQADWNANALAKAKTYQDSMSMSPAAIHDQLTSEHGEQFTVEEADYAIQHLND